MNAAPGLSRETRWLRLGGIALVIFFLCALLFLQEVADPQNSARSGDGAMVTWIVVGFVVSVNGFVLGLVLLLAGLRQLSLLTNRQARRGALTRMAATNLMLLAIAIMAFEDGTFGTAFHSDWLLAALLVAFVLVARASIVLFRSGWKYEAHTAEEALASDPRRPVVYLRSFGIDDQILVTTRNPAARLAALVAYTASVSPEQEMAFIMERIGPVVAIGKPGERLPELGAARRYVADDEWRVVVGNLMNEAALVVIRGGETASLWWEITEAMTRCPPERVIIIALGQPKTLATFERRFAEAFGTPVAPAVPRAQWLTTLLRLLFPHGPSPGKIIYFDEHRRPYEQPLRYRLTWSGTILLPYRPYRDSLQGAFRIVFAKLDLPWTPKRTQTTAVLLALFGGMFGLHLFYMGHKRRAIRYCALFWLAVPMILGWIDAIRLALLDETQFRAQLNLD